MTESMAMLWAVTSYFNPCNYRRRLANYHVFRERLQVPLVTVEFASSGDFQLQPEDAEVMIRVTGADVMWQKERLLNVGIQALPAACDKVAWLDCDVVFENDDWAAVASDALDRHPVIQPFERSVEIKDDQPGMECESLAKALSSGRVKPDILRVSDKRLLQVACGFAWAARREVLDHHGLYDACIMGGGDGAVIGAVHGNFQDLVDYLLMNPRRAAHYLEWATRFYDTVSGDLGFSAGTLYHLWHGEMSDRHYNKRRVAFAEFDFDPALDLAIDLGGCWRWNSPKPDMHEFVRGYFSWRMEDGRPASHETSPPEVKS